MDKFEPDQESVSRAEELSSHLMDALHSVVRKGPDAGIRRELFSKRRFVEQAQGVPVADVVTHVNQMATELAVAHRWGDEIICFKLDGGEPAPISMTTFFGGQMGADFGHADWMEFWERFGGPFPFHRIWREIYKRADFEKENLQVSDVASATEGAHRNLSHFLAYRFAGFKKWAEWFGGGGDGWGGDGGGGGGTKRPAGTPPPPAVGSGGGLQVQVSCLTPGLRIHVAPAFFINWVYFGSPTTPVTGYVLPGRYVFAGDGPMLPKFTKDNGVFCIPPSYHPALTRF